MDPVDVERWVLTSWDEDQDVRSKTAGVYFIAFRGLCITGQGGGSRARHMTVLTLATVAQSQHI